MLIGNSAINYVITTHLNKLNNNCMPRLVIMPGRLWLKTAEELSDKYRSYRKFYNGIGTRDSVIINYSYSMNKFMDFLTKMKYVKNASEFEKLISFEPKQVTEALQDYVFYCNKKVKGVSVRSYLSGPELFFDMNDVLWNRRIVKKSIHRDDTVPGGAKAATDNDVYELIDVCNNRLESALLHFLFSTGIRPGAIDDPILKIKHLIKMPHGCYAIKVYDESKEGYWAFLTPEAAKALDNYINWRKMNGEEITPESALFRPTRKKKKLHLESSTARDIVYKIIRRSGIKRVKTGHRYDKAVIYMFRKRFNGKLKMDENNINSNIAEKLMAHNSKEIKLDTNYLDVPLERLFKEFQKAIFELTVSREERQKVEIQVKNQEIKELEAKEQTIDKLSEQVRDLKSTGPMTDEVKNFIKELVMDKINT